jgi:hypothetical protein
MEIELQRQRSLSVIVIVGYCGGTAGSGEVDVSPNIVFPRSQRPSEHIWEEDYQY